MTEHNHNWSPRGDLSNHTTVAYDCTCGAIGIKKWTNKGLTPIKISDEKTVKGDGFSHASQNRMSKVIQRGDEQQRSLTSEKRFERMMGLGK